MKIVVIDKNCNVKQAIIQEQGLSVYCKKAGFKSETDFDLRTTWKGAIKDGRTFEIDLYAKNNGRAGYENKYEFPPPVDKNLFFGSCVLINKKGDLTCDMWKEIYNQLHGGFDDIDSEGDESVEDEEILRTTRQGYEKDGFVVDDDELSEEDYV